jgi:hypothetical protein
MRIDLAEVAIVFGRHVGIALLVPEGADSAPQGTPTAILPSHFEDVVHSFSD